MESSVVKKVGGMGILMRHVLDLFFTRHDFRAGMLLNFEQPQMLFAKFGFMISDEAAIKSVCGNKGAAGTVLCLQCQNCIDHKADLTSHDVSERLVASTCTDMSRFRLHNAESVQATLDYLRAQQPLLAKGAFAKLEQSLGFNWQNETVMSHEAVGGRLAVDTMYDWFHVYFVHGIANTHAGLFLGKLLAAGHAKKEIEDFIDGFSYPARLRGSKPHKVLDKRKASDPLKCSASETINFCILLRVFVNLFVWDSATPPLKQDCAAFYRLMEVADMLLSLARSHAPEGQASELARRIRLHLDGFQEQCGIEHWTPKCHLALHLPLQLARHQLLISCFTHERKHKMVKKLANHVLDTSKAFEKSVLSDIALQSMRELSDEERMSLGVVRILSKRPAPRRLKDVLGPVLGTQEIFTAAQAVHGGGYLLSHNDAVCFTMDGCPRVGLAQYTVEADGVCWTCVSPWETVHGCVFRVKGEAFLVKTRGITDTCMFSLKGETAIVVLPD
ncbi:unnamed protein product [Effrenium voratum]|nr:unnamed protein product [Effrenium voratum]